MTDSVVRASGVMRALVLALWLGTSGVAYADLIAPDQEQCQGRNVGDRCEAGVCVARRCTSTGRPGVPGSEYDCVVCSPDGGSPLPIVIGIGAGALALAGGIWFAKRRKVT